VAHLELCQCSETHTDELETELLRQDIQDYRNVKTDKPSKLKEEFRNASEKAKKIQRPKKDRGNDRGYEPEI